MSERIQILVGTMTGTAELVAAEVADVVRAEGFDVEILPMDGLSASAFENGSVFLVISSTYGNGDVPDNAQTFMSSLQTERPQLGHMVYGVIALGDITYKATFCEGGLQFDRMLSELGATRVGEPLRHDASSGVMAEDAACAWAGDWIAHALRPKLAA